MSNVTTLASEESAAQAASETKEAVGEVIAAYSEAVDRIQETAGESGNSEEITAEGPPDASDRVSSLMGNIADGLADSLRGMTASDAHVEAPADEVQAPQERNWRRIFAEIARGVIGIAAGDAMMPTAPLTAVQTGVEAMFHVRAGMQEALGHFGAAENARATAELVGTDPRAFAIKLVTTIGLRNAGFDAAFSLQAGKVGAAAFDFTSSGKNSADSLLNSSLSKTVHFGVEYAHDSKAFNQELNTLRDIVSRSD